MNDPGRRKVGEEGGYVGGFFRMLMGVPFLRPIMRPFTRFLVGMIAVPLMRLFLRKVVRVSNLDEEMEKDIEQWFRGALVLLVATRSFETWLFGVEEDMSLRSEWGWVILGFRLLLAISVVEMMPDQELFAVIHPGPPKLNLDWKYGIFREIREKKKEIIKGFICQHLNRSSPVFAILAAIVPGNAGWFCYGMALIQYLIIGLVTSRDKAMDVLSEFDRQVAQRRRELIDEFHIDDQTQVSASEKSAKRIAEDVAEEQAERESRKKEED